MLKWSLPETCDENNNNNKNINATTTTTTKNTAEYYVSTAISSSKVISPSSKIKDMNGAVRPCHRSSKPSPLTLKKPRGF